MERQISNNTGPEQEKAEEVKIPLEPVLAVEMIGIESAEAIGTLDVVPIISASGIETGEATGLPDISLDVNTTGIISSETLGAPSVEPFPFPAFLELNSRFCAMAEFKDGLGELLSMCSSWIKEQADFEVNEFKKAMVLAFYNLCNEQILKTMAELRDIDPKVKAMLESIQKEVPYGRPEKNR
jgi:hypothetical protein